MTMDVEQSTSICSSRLAKLIKVGFVIIFVEIIVIGAGAGLIYGIHFTSNSEKNETIISPADAILQTTQKGIIKMELILSSPYQIQRKNDEIQ